jgi:hypothetical protein
MKPTANPKTEPKTQVLGNLIIDLKREGKLNNRVIYCLNRARERLAGGPAGNTQGVYSIPWD